MHKWVFFFFFVCILIAACDPKPRDREAELTTADSTTIPVDSVMAILDSASEAADSALTDSAVTMKTAAAEEDAKIDLWDPNLFDSIPKYSAQRPFKTDSFEHIINRYEHDDFVYSENIKDKVGVLQRIFSRLTDWLSSMMPDNPYKFREEFGYLFAFLALIALAFILYKVLYNKKQYFIKHDQEEDELDTLAYVERNLMNSNLDPYIQDAMVQKNYALSIRYLQLLNIQKLAHAGYVKWKHSKTNAEFAQEIRDENLRQGFMDCTRIFDYVWFGQFELAESDFNQYKVLFSQYQNQIK
ncbi:DUF4129 domain-containing protein [Sphingobacterium sp. N143]|uniref:DUF4129 domain-containing protein n=1 Tax=Sphingobacterium sp. N143 TaxID=2746727 RepID=UPI002578DA38|nr:DUF4129 domain-containing protein [Sphingobacterium sp. N143]MDM1296768.1 DUF4129 domain-containing protein [Sphingobacterium sp. N143]